MCSAERLGINPPILLDLGVLTAQVPFQPRDFEANASAFACHQTQYSPQQQEAGLARS
jgi:hypothetical protein